MADLSIEGNTTVSIRGDFRQSLALLGRYLIPQRKQMAWMTMTLLAGILLKLLNPQVLRYFLDTAQTGGETRGLYAAAGLFLAFAFIQQGLGLAAQTLATRVGWTATNRMRADLVTHVLGLDLSFYKLHPPGELIERTEENVSQLSSFLSSFSVHVLGNSLLVIGILALLFWENPWLGLAMLAYTLVTLLALGWIIRLAAPRWAAERRASADLYGFIEERISGAQEIRALGAEKYIMNGLYQRMRAFTQSTRSAMVVAGLSFNLTNLVYVLGFAAGLAFGAWLYLRGEASLGAAYLITHYVGMLADPLQSLRQQAEELQHASANARRISELFELQPKIPAQPAESSSLSDARRLPPGALAVRFEDVSFRYEDGSDETTGRIHALREVSFEIQPGHVLGVLGRSGSGKSTLTRLLFRLYDPQAGIIRLGEQDLRSLEVGDLRRRVALVTQDVQLFNASVRDNLTFFNGGISDERLRMALEFLGIWDWVQSLPKGLDTHLGGAQGFSAGEAQLLAFARVFLKDPGLVVLDEASSRLDLASETRLERAIDNLLAQRTGLIIAHRLQTVQRVDDLLILENGRVSEYGRRATLANDPTSHFARLLKTGLAEALK